MKKQLSFTLIEVIISISILSMILISVFTIFDKYISDEIKITKNEKFIYLSEKLEENLYRNYLNFVINDDVLYFNYELIGGSKNNNKIINTETLYPSYQLVPLYNNNNLDKVLSFWNVNKKEIEQRVGIPFDMIITNQKDTYKNILFPFKKIYLFDWGKLEELRNFKNVKDCIFFINDKNEVELNRYDELDIATNFSGSDCKPIVRNFIIRNNNSLNGRLNSSKMESSYKNIINEVKMKKISNFKVVKKKIEITLNKFNKIEDNLKDYVRRENELLGKNNELSIDHFVSCYFDIEAASNLNHCRLSNFMDDDPINNNKVKFFFNNGLWYFQKNNDGSITNYFNKNMLIKDLKNVIITFEPRSGANEHLRPVQFLRGTTAYNVDELKEFEDISRIQLTGMVSMKMPMLIEDEVDGFSQTNKMEAGLGELSFVPETYKIFGLYDESGLSKQGVSEFFEIPFYFTNITGSSIRIDNYFNGEMYRKNFDINVPLIKNQNTINEMHISGPYSAGIIIIFPWILNSNQELMNTSNYGFHFKTLSTSVN